ncbi:UDP-2,4-diacetamido-2,4,6-trideoxy-beta-L-altropyranose hydrolase [Gammaproteobacteria bacterium]|nr:UDP-2,4-diacetamido-2,4,6-trideoxy-beta-L-altropyranose hydrolase [Gammaproteobacteria bacterium]
MTKKSKLVVFRADASVQIGTGHIMRCLTLADELTRQGHECRFICRDHQGHLGELIADKGFAIDLLVTPSEADPNFRHDNGIAHAQWLGVSWQLDAAQTLSLLESLVAEWLVVDHYSIDARWEREVRQVVGRIMVIDDLADRDHHADTLLDQNALNKDTEARYLARVNSGCNLLLGPDYALLGKEYSLLSTALPERDGHISRVLVFVGGSDPYHLTESYIKTLCGRDFLHLLVDVVIGRNHPAPKSVENLVATRSLTRLYSELSSLSALMIRADLMLGSGGSTNWERMCLGLNAIVISVASNQYSVNQELSRKGLISLLGTAEEVTLDTVSSTLKNVLANPTDNAIQARSIRAIVDGKGCQRVVNVLLGQIGL